MTTAEETQRDSEGALSNPSAVGLVAVIVAATDGEPRALTVQVGGQARGRSDGLPAGPLSDGAGSSRAGCGGAAHSKGAPTQTDSVFSARFRDSS